MLRSMVSIEQRLASFKMLSLSKIGGHGECEYWDTFEKYALVIWQMFFDHNMKSIALN